MGKHLIKCTILGFSLCRGGAELLFSCESFPFYKRGNDVLFLCQKEKGRKRSWRPCRSNAGACGSNGDQSQIKLCANKFACRTLWWGSDVYLFFVRLGAYGIFALRAWCLLEFSAIPIVLFSPQWTFTATSLPNFVGLK